MTLDAEGAVQRARFHNGVMRSHARLTYSKVHEILTEPGSSLRDEHAELVPMLENLHALYGVLAKARRARGAIEFESNETRIVFDGEKKISELVPVVRNDAHKLIEECMILANIQAAAFLEKNEIPALYRVHNGPKADRLEDLRAFLALHGLSVGGGATPSAADYAKLSRAIADRPDQSVIQTVMLRSMQQAVYQPKNEGHFGLALDQYAHFTSPIRRYPDLLVHRAIKHAISRERNASYRYSPADMQAFGESCSVTERRAEEASRDVVSWLKCEYMQQHVGSEFEGVVSSVVPFGLFVELSGIHVEGLIHITNLSRDFYRFDAAAHALIGERTGQRYHLGDAIVVQVASVNLDERKIDFVEIAHVSSKGRKKGKPALTVVEGGKPGETRKRAGESGGGKSKSRKRREGKRRRAKERAAAGAERSDPVSSAPEKESVASASAGEKELNPEHRRQLKRREKERRREEKRAARRSEKRARKEVEAAASDGGKAARSSSWASQPEESARVASSAGASAEAAAGEVARPATVAAESAVEAASAQVAPARAAAKKAASRKAAAKKAASKKAAAKKAAAGSKVAAKKAASKKAAAKKAAAGRKVAAKKAASKKAAAKKATAGSKVAAKKAASKKAAAKKAAAGSKAAAKKAAAKKAAATKSDASKKKVAAKKAAKNAGAGKAAARRTAETRTGAKKVRAEKADAKTARAKKVGAKKPGASKVGPKGTGRLKAAAESAGTGKGKVASKKVGKKTAGKKKASAKATAKKTGANTSSAKKAGSKKATTRAASKKGVAGRAGAKKARGKRSGGGEDG